MVTVKYTLSERQMPTICHNISADLPAVWAYYGRTSARRSYEAREPNGSTGHLPLIPSGLSASHSCRQTTGESEIRS